VESVVHALRNIHAALVPGAFLVDTQPVSPDPRVATEQAELGSLDMRVWLRTIHGVDEQFAKAIAAGLYGLQHEQRFVVTDSFDDGHACLDAANGWRDTRIPSPLASRLEATPTAVSVKQEVRLRLLRRC
jgi:hypothetical protein